MAEIQIDQRALQRLIQSPSGPLIRGMERAGTRLENQTKRNLTSGDTRAVDTGRLRASISHQVRVQGEKVIVRVGTDVEYARHVHEGHGIIRPRRAKFLRFPAGPNTPASAISRSGFVFAKQVRATDPRPYLKKALDALRVSDLFG